MRFAKSLVVFILLGVAAAAVVPDIAVRDAAVDVEELHKTPHDIRDTTVEDVKGHFAVQAVLDTVDHDHRHSVRDTAEEKKDPHKGHPSTRSAPEGDARIHHDPRDAGEENDKGHHKGHSFARDAAGEDKGHHKHTRNTSVKGKKGDRKGHHARDIAADKKGHHKTHNARDTAEQDKKGHHKGN
ncbi:hypothetical protein L210DRAFT_3507152 [Boletus edulis BED1]|uniref:Uncharacterized protein n=1 Tax=Boletus edulis BED1 TaxID=1328754 RepID=A0AAD4BKI3_BOLED|nr:hypothetical protein L210DRAFT_3507152 [Boletus edulis BED1]